MLKNLKKLFKTKSERIRSSDDGSPTTQPASPQGQAHNEAFSETLPKMPSPQFPLEEGDGSYYPSPPATPKDRNPLTSSSGSRAPAGIKRTVSTAKHETTIFERQGSIMILKQVKELEPTPEPEIPMNVEETQSETSYRRVQRVASMPLLCDGALEAKKNDVADKGKKEEDQSANTDKAKDARRKRRPKRNESLKSLLKLDQYSFNSDLNVNEALKVVLDGSSQSQLMLEGNVNDIINADGKTAILVTVSQQVPHKMRRSRWSVEDYILLKQLHKGYASDVFQAKCKLSGEMVALKVYKLAEQGDIQRMQLYREIRLHSKLRHTNIIQFYACFLESNRVVMVQEYAAGDDLLRYMYKCGGGRLFERQAVNMVLQPFLAAMHYLHTQGIVHRDIKPENVLFTDQRVLKLADFGLAIDLTEERANTRAGTLDYMAPEVLRCPTKKTPDENKLNPISAHYHQGVDAWAVGVFAYELIVGVPPFKAGQMIDTARNIIHAQVEFPPNTSELAKDFISAALKKHAADRPTALEMLHHPWITMFQRRSSVRTSSASVNPTSQNQNPTLDKMQLMQQQQQQQQQQGVSPQPSAFASPNAAPVSVRGVFRPPSVQAINTPNAGNGTGGSPSQQAFLSAASQVGTGHNSPHPSSQQSAAAAVVATQFQLQQQQQQDQLQQQQRAQQQQQQQQYALPHLRSMQPTALYSVNLADQANGPYPPHGGNSTAANSTTAAPASVPKRRSSALGTYPTGSPAGAGTFEGHQTLVSHQSYHAGMSASPNQALIHQQYPTAVTPNAGSLPHHHMSIQTRFSGPTAVASRQSSPLPPRSSPSGNASPVTPAAALSTVTSGNAPNVYFDRNNASVAASQAAAGNMFPSEAGTSVQSSVSLPPVVTGSYKNGYPVKAQQNMGSSGLMSPQVGSRATVLASALTADYSNKTIFNRSKSTKDM